MYLLCEAGVLLQEQCLLHLQLCPIFLHITQRCEKKVELQSSLCSLNIQSFGSQGPLKAEMGVQTCDPGRVLWFFLAGELGESSDFKEQPSAAPSWCPVKALCAREQW